MNFKPRKACKNSLQRRNPLESADHFRRQPRIGCHQSRKGGKCIGRKNMSKKRLIVMKFGGTSVGNAERFQQCAEIVREAAKKDRIIVVVSAVAGVTDVILKTIEAARQGDAVGADAALGKLEVLHREVIAELF